METAVLVLVVCLCVCLLAALAGLVMAATRAQATARHLANQLVLFNWEHREAQRNQIEGHNSEALALEARARYRAGGRRSAPEEPEPDIKVELPT